MLSEDFTIILRDLDDLLDVQNQLHSKVKVGVHSPYFVQLLGELSNLKRRLSACVEYDSFQIDVLISEMVIKKFNNFFAFFSAFSRELIESLHKESERSCSLLCSNIEHLRYLNWPVIHKNLFLSEIDNSIEEMVLETCKSEFTEVKLPELKQWARNCMPPIVSLLFEFKEKRSIVNRNFDQSVCAALVKLRAYELYDMVADFPESITAIKEFREAMLSTNSMAYVAKVFKSAIIRRLLHPGASTKDILQQYILLIRTLRILDPSDVFLNYSADPVQKYLLRRKDTVRCIVASLTDTSDSSDSELHAELRKGGSLEYGADSDDEDGGPGLNWEPKKRNTELNQTGTLGKGNSGQDVLAILVSIYKNFTDLFVSEYRSLLAEKLLSNLTYTSDQEIKILELLKIRFGEDNLHACEVMLRDLEESKRINNAINSELGKYLTAVPSNLSNLSCSNITDFMVISHCYWPELKADETVSHHPKARSHINSFLDTYALLKKPRKLHVAQQLGTVELDLEFDDGSTRSFTVNPTQASLIMYLGDEKRLSSADLAHRCGIEDVADVVNRMSFWISKGVVREIRVMSELSTDIEGTNHAVFYEIIEEQAKNALSDGDSDGIYGFSMDLDEQVIIGAEAQEKAALLKVTNYIKGMLRSHGSMPLDRIHTMLRMMDSGVDMNLVQLNRFLLSMVDNEVLEFFDNSYRMKKA